MNPCVTGDTKVWTVEGTKTFKELAEVNDDVNVYCLDGDGNVVMSKMFHPRMTGHVEILNVTLNDGTKFKVTPNHMFLTKEGYACAEDLMEGDEVVVLNDSVDLPTGIDEQIKSFTDYTGTKKGTVIKKCEVTGEEFERTWDEREVCVREGYEADLYEMKTRVATISDNYDYRTVESVEYIDGRTDVYNGTVAVYHNYFTVDETTGTKVNQLNCGE